MEAVKEGNPSHQGSMIVGHAHLDVGVRVFGEKDKKVITVLPKGGEGKRHSNGKHKKTGRFDREGIRYLWRKVFLKRTTYMKIKKRRGQKEDGFSPTEPTREGKEGVQTKFRKIRPKDKGFQKKGGDTRGGKRTSTDEGYRNYRKTPVRIGSSRRLRGHMPNQKRGTKGNTWKKGKRK